MKLWTDFSGNESFNFLCSFLQNKSFPKKWKKLWFVLLQLNLFLLNKHFFSPEILFSLFLCINSSLSSGRENFQTHNELWRPDCIKASNSRKCNFSSKAQELTPPPIFLLQIQLLSLLLLSRRNSWANESKTISSPDERIVRFFSLKIVPCWAGLSNFSLENLTWVALDKMLTVVFFN